MEQVEHVYTTFEEALIIGKYLEKLIAHEFQYQGLPLEQTIGKNKIDFYLPDGRSIEAKFDIRSGFTGSGLIEWPTVCRHPDFIIQCFTYLKVYTGPQYEQLYHEGKKPWGQVGDLGYDAHMIRNMGQQGTPLHQFINNLKNDR